MKSLFAPLLSILALSFLLGGCEKAPTPPDSKVLIQTIEDNVHAMEKKDLDAVMATIHSKGPYFQSTRDTVAEVFKVLDLKYTLSDLQVVSASPEEAHVSFVQKTEKIGGEGEFQGNIQQGIHILRPDDDGKWKIFRTQLVKITGLDGRPLGATEEAAAPEPAAPPAPAPTEPPATPSASPVPGEKPPQ
jgi:ketosteroid isomerase-like protein